ncbi:TonB-dependent receptor [Polaribacter sp.]|nr:TonB-dependent receptor [Polaribacter sp.]
MKRAFLLFLIYFSFLSLNAQKKEQVKDTIKTEIVNIITKYNPKIADAKKIEKNPKIELLKKNEKKKIKYTILSAPVASTFIPKSGTLKRRNNLVKERSYKNYIAAGFGNFTSPYFETFLYHNTHSKNEFGFNATYVASQENVKNSILNSNFLDFKTRVFYKQQERSLAWKIGLNSERNLYNWYGLPKKNFTTPTINSIDEAQIYNYFQLVGTFNFKDSYLDYGEIKTSYFADSFKSNEVLVTLDAKLDFPLTAIHPILNDISLKTGIEFLKGEFKNSYEDFNAPKYAINTIRLNPQYPINYKDFIFKAGLKLITSLDSENNSNSVFVLPDFFFQQSILKNHLTLYADFSGDLYTNTYKDFAEENAYISPTLFITQTLEKSNLSIGFKGVINKKIHFNLKASYKEEEDKPLFLRNSSKSDGTNTTVNDKKLKGYEYGNSFHVIYDDVKTTRIFTELSYKYSKNMSFDLDGIYNIYTIENAIKPWNLPRLEASFSSRYKNKKWAASTNIFYVSERKDALYNENNNIQTLPSFVDVNLNGSYQLNNKFSAFLKLKNILNTNYQRFANFNTQGFQILGGITYQFDF